MEVFSLSVLTCLDVLYTIQQLTLILFVCTLPFLRCATAVGLDHLMAQHIAHLFIRDPVLILAEQLEQDLEKDMGHFEVSQYDGAILERNVFESCRLCHSHALVHCTLYCVCTFIAQSLPVYLSPLPFPPFSPFLSLTLPLPSPSLFPSPLFLLLPSSFTSPPLTSIPAPPSIHRISRAAIGIP